MPTPSAIAASEWIPYLLSNASEHAVIFLDDAGRVVGWLGASESLFGYPESEAIGLGFDTFFTAEDRHLQMDRQELAVARVSGRSEDERWHVRKDGSRFWASGLVAPVKRPDGTQAGYCKVLRDRTDLRERIEALEAGAGTAQRERDRQAQALIALGHEMRNVVAPLRSAATLMARTDDAARRKELTGILGRQLTALETLLDDLARMATGDDTVPSLALQPVVVQEAVAIAVGCVRDAAVRQGLELRLILPPVAFEVNADPSRLQQMLLNLLGNALKYTPPGGHVDVTASVEATDAVIRVVDDGVGISSEALPRIFALFARGERIEGTPGMGVGLAVVKELATLHGGLVEARSAGEGKGSVFALRLPLRSRDPNAGS
jgi:PAS domain S-box-containing protein